MSARTSLQTAQVRPGDFHLPPDSRQRFGRSQLLSSDAGTSSSRQGRSTAAYVETPVYDEPQEWTIELRAGAVGGIMSRILPDLGGGTAYTLRIRIRRALDRDKGVAEEVYEVAPPTIGDQNTLPVGCVIAQQLAVYVELIDTTGTVNLVVDVTCTRTTTCLEPSWASSISVRPVQQILTQVFLPANDRRRQFFVQNWGSSPLYLALFPSADPPAGSQPRWTVALPSQGDIYESFVDGYQGIVSGAWDTDDANGYAMVTEGT